MHFASLAPRSLLRAFLGTVLALAVAGCESAEHKNSLQPQVFQPHNFIGDAQLPQNLRRVVILPIYSGEVTAPETAADLDPVFAEALNRQMRFEVVTLTRDECLRRFGREAISSSSALPIDFLKTIARDKGADGVLFIDLTAFSPYRPLQMGIRAKLASITDARLIWSFDEVFSAENPAVANAIRRYFATNSPTDIPMDETSSAFISPAKYATYVADTVFKTLPKR